MEWKGTFYMPIGPWRTSRFTGCGPASQTEHSVSCSIRYAPSGKFAPSMTKMAHTPGYEPLRVETARGTLPQIPHLIDTKEGHRFLVTVKGRQPKCLRCGALGHTRSDCPQSWAGQQRSRQGLQQQKQQQQAPKMTSLGHVPVTRPSAATKAPATTRRGQDALIR